MADIISPDALCLILEHQSIRTINACRRVCKRWNDIISRQPQLYHGKFVAWIGDKHRRIELQQEVQQKLERKRLSFITKLVAKGPQHERRIIEWLLAMVEEDDRDERQRLYEKIMT